MARISKLGKQDRPREKIKDRGVESLSDYELLMAIIGSGTAQADVTKIAKDIQKLFDEKGSDLLYEDLLKIKSLGPAKSTQIIASFELWRRKFEVSERPIVDSNDVAVALLAEIRDKKQEYFMAITLDGANRIIAKRVIAIGTLTASLVHPREVFTDAIADRAASIIVGHNHPSGNTEPSRPDIELTRRLKDSSELLGIKLIDHIIITKDSSQSITLDN